MKDYPYTRANLLTFQGKIGRCHARILIDSGATENFVAQTFLDKNKMKTVTIPDGPKVELADGGRYDCTQALKQATLYIGPYQEEILAYAMPLKHHDVILGKSWLSANNPAINWTDHSLPSFRIATLVLPASFGKVCLKHWELSWLCRRPCTHKLMVVNDLSN